MRGVRIGLRLRGVCIGLLVLLGCGPLRAGEVDRTIHQFVHTAWTEKEGAPSGGRALAQTQDGYLWIGTADGLFRFDGMRFERFEPPLHDALPAQWVQGLQAFPNGDLWIGFRTGEISLLRDGRITSYSTAREGLAGWIGSFAQDREGTIWAGGDAGLLRLEGDRFRVVGEDWGFAGKKTLSTFVDRHGTLWVATDDTLVFLPPGAKRFQTTGIAVGAVLRFAEAADGTLWMAELTRSVRPVPLPEILGQMSDPPEVQVGSRDILFDKDGALWISTLGDGLRRAPVPGRLQGKIGQFSDAVEIFTAKNGLTDDTDHAILEDREGSIWVTTQVGLDRFRKGKFVPVPLPGPSFRYTLAAGDKGDVWVFGMTSPTIAHAFPSGAYTVEVEDTAPQTCATNAAGGIGCLGYYGGVLLEHGRASRFPLPEEIPKPYADEPRKAYLGVMRVAFDRSGTLWASFQDHGVYCFQNQAWKRVQTPPELIGVKAASAFTDRTGQPWFGYDDGTILTVSGSEVKILASRGESPVGDVRAMRGANGQVWVGGASGLALFDGTTFRRIAPADAEAFGRVHGIAVTRGGDLWLCESRGVIHVGSTEVRRVLESSADRVQYEVYDRFDGLPGGFQDAGNESRVIEASDGRLWVAADGGIAWLDPARRSKNTVPPPVSIITIAAGGKTYPPSAKLVLPALTRELQLRYTALSLAVPERVRFRYKLEGAGDEWHEAGANREAFFTNLGPGEYRFQVIACNSDGLWNEQGATLQFSIAPAWYQTTAFRALCVLTALLILWGLYRLRLRQVEASIRVLFDERLAERTRLARDLHDTLLQTIQGSKLVADVALDPSTDAVRMRASMQKLSGWLEQAMQEGRAALNSLRTSTTEGSDLMQALKRATQSELIPGSMGVEWMLQGDPREIHPIVRDEVYRIGYEAIRNACVHARASRLTVRLEYGNNLLLEIKDDGIGMGEALTQAGKPGHFGLQGMRERAERIESKLTLDSSEATGTTLCLLVPGGIAFRKVRATVRSRLRSFLGFRPR